MVCGKGCLVSTSGLLSWDESRFSLADDTLGSRFMTIESLLEALS